MKYRQYISYSLLAISGVFLLCTVFATDTGLANGLVTGKVLWFHLAMLLLATCSLVAAILTKPVKPFVFSVADGLVLVLAAIVALTYNRQLDPEPEKMLFGGAISRIVVSAAVPIDRMAAVTVIFPGGGCCDRRD